MMAANNGLCLFYLVFLRLLALSSYDSFLFCVLDKGFGELWASWEISYFNARSMEMTIEIEMQLKERHWCLCAVMVSFFISCNTLTSI